MSAFPTFLLEHDDGQIIKLPTMYEPGDLLHKIERLT